MHLPLLGSPRTPSVHHSFRRHSSPPDQPVKQANDQLTGMAIGRHFFTSLSGVKLLGMHIIPKGLWEGGLEGYWVLLGSQECPRVSQEHPRSPPKGAQERPKGPKFGYLGWFWRPDLPPNESEFVPNLLGVESKDLEVNVDHSNNNMTEYVCELISYLRK